LNACIIINAKVKTQKLGAILSQDPSLISLTPGFSQVTTGQLRIGNRLNGFGALSAELVTWLKPGVNEKYRESFSRDG
jgi:hypothetical protein